MHICHNLQNVCFLHKLDKVKVILTYTRLCIATAADGSTWIKNTFKSPDINNMLVFIYIHQALDIDNCSGQKYYGAIITN